jgi:hypothetical protein
MKSKPFSVSTNNLEMQNCLERTYGTESMGISLSVAKFFKKSKLRIFYAKQQINGHQSSTCPRAKKRDTHRAIEIIPSYYKILKNSYLCAFLH